MEPPRRIPEARGAGRRGRLQGEAPLAGGTPKGGGTPGGVPATARDASSTRGELHGRCRPGFALPDRQKQKHQRRPRCRERLWLEGAASLAPLGQIRTRLEKRAEIRVRGLLLQAWLRALIPKHHISSPQLLLQLPTPWTAAGCPGGSPAPASPPLLLHQPRERGAGGGPAEPPPLPCQPVLAPATSSPCPVPPNVAQKVAEGASRG